MSDIFNDEMRRALALDAQKLRDQGVPVDDVIFLDDAPVADSPTPAVRPDAPTKDPLLAKVVGPTPNVGASSSSLGVGAARVSDDGASTPNDDVERLFLETNTEYAVAEIAASNALDAASAPSASAGAPETGDLEQRVSDYRSGYSAGYQHATVGRPAADEPSAALFFNIPVWDVCVRFIDRAGDDEPCSHCETIRAESEEAAAELAEERLLREIPSAVIRQSEVTPYTPDEPAPAARVSAGAEPYDPSSEPFFACFGGSCSHQTRLECDTAIYYEVLRLERENVEQSAELARLRAPAPDAGRFAKLLAEYSAARTLDALYGVGPVVDEASKTLQEALVDAYAARLRERDATIELEQNHRLNYSFALEKYDTLLRLVAQIGDVVDRRGDHVTPDDVLEGVRLLRGSFVGMCERLHAAVRDLSLGLGGEHVDALVVDALRERTAKLAAAEQENAALKSDAELLDALSRREIAYEAMGTTARYFNAWGERRQTDLLTNAGRPLTDLRTLLHEALAAARSTPIPATADPQEKAE